jgi:hypothetical protein
MSIKIKLAQLSLSLALFASIVAALPAVNTTLIAFGSPDLMTMGDCSGGTGCST